MKGNLRPPAAVHRQGTSKVARTSPTEAPAHPSRAGASPCTMGTVVLSSTKRRVLRRDGYACRYCGQRVYPDVDPAHPARLTYDHLIPAGSDGADSPTNLVVACFTCNHEKAQHPPVGRWAPLYPPKPPPSYAPISDGYSPEPIVPTETRWRIRRRHVAKRLDRGGPDVRPDVLTTVPEAFAALRCCPTCGVVSVGDHECATVTDLGCVDST